MKSNLISKTETAMLTKELEGSWRTKLPKNKNLRIYHIGDARIVQGDGVRALGIGGDHVPFLSESELLEKFPSVIIDMGAVKFVCKGANVMRPGIKGHGEFAKGDIVTVLEESHSKCLAVGRALKDSAELDTIERGEVIRTIHHISDRYWEAAKEIR